MNVTSVCSSELGFEEEYGVPVGRNLIFIVNNEFILFVTNASKESVYANINRITCAIIKHIMKNTM